MQWVKPIILANSIRMCAHSVKPFIEHSNFVLPKCFFVYIRFTFSIENIHSFSFVLNGYRIEFSMLLIVFHLTFSKWELFYILYINPQCTSKYRMWHSVFKVIFKIEALILCECEVRSVFRHEKLNVGSNYFAAHDIQWILHDWRN